MDAICLVFTRLIIYVDLGIIIIVWLLREPSSCVLRSSRVVACSHPRSEWNNSSIIDLHCREEEIYWHTSQLAVRAREPIESDVLTTFSLVPLRLQKQRTSVEKEIRSRSEESNVHGSWCMEDDVEAL